jgi:4a-hydroxytetrahydrobiopterin dehydratase
MSAQMNYSTKKCAPCDANAEKASASEVAHALERLSGWHNMDGVAISAEWTFSNFSKAKTFIDKVSALAEEENHHPDISFGWGYAKIKLTTHAIDGLSENDFSMAAKINALQA